METTPAASTLPAAVSPRLPEAVRVLLAVVVLVVAIFAPNLVGLLPGVREWSAGLSMSGQVAAGVVLMAGTTLLAIAFVALLARYVDRLRLSDYGLRWNAGALPTLLLGIAISVAVVVPLSLALDSLGLLRPSEGRPDGLSIGLFIVFALAQAFLLQGIPEEVIFRGYLTTTLRNRGPVAAVWISAIVFGILHLISQGGQQSLLEHVLYLAWPFGFGLAAGALCLVTGSVWVAIGIHGGSHVATLVNGLLGAGEGPAAWAGVGILYTLVGLVVLARFRKRAGSGVRSAG